MSFTIYKKNSKNYYKVFNSVNSISNWNYIGNSKKQFNDKFKKPIYKKWWFWILILILVIGLGVNFNDSEDNDMKESSIISSESSDYIKETTSIEQITEEIEKIPSIKGSQAYDVLLSIEEKTGLKRPDTNIEDDCYIWDQVTSDYSYHIVANTNHEISYAEFFIFNQNYDEFLEFCATIPYDTARSDEAVQWVKNNKGKEAHTSFGDAEYILTNGNQGPILKISAHGYDEYLKNKISYSENNINDNQIESSISSEQISNTNNLNDTSSQDNEPSNNTINSNNSDNNTGNLVWIPTNGGKKYHSNSSCSSMKNPTQVTVEYAQNSGYEPCKRCY